MTDHTETLIKDTLRRQADRAVDPTVLFAGMEARQPVRHTGRILAGVAAAVVLLLVAGAYVVARGGSGPAVQAAAAQPAATPMPYQPHWLPPGVTEQMREVAGQTTTRLWVAGHVDEYGRPADYVPWVSVQTAPGHLTQDGTAATVDGKPARLRVEYNDAVIDKETKLSWEPTPGTVVTVDVGGKLNGKEGEYVQRVADSVRPDGTAKYAPKVWLNPVPDGWVAASSREMGADPAHAVVGMEFDTLFKGHKGTAELTVRPGSPLVFLGYSGSIGVISENPGDGDLRGQGWPPTGPSYPDFQPLMHAPVAIDQQADLSWMGTR